MCKNESEPLYAKQVVVQNCFMYRFATFAYANVSLKVPCIVVGDMMI